MEKQFNLEQLVGGTKEAAFIQLKKLLQTQPLTDGELADALVCTPAFARTCINDLKSKKVRVAMGPDARYFIHASEPGGRVVIENKTGRLKLGFTTDNHIGNRHFRKDVMHAAYDDFARRGVTSVLNAGNMIEGVARFNKLELLAHTLDGQLEMWVNEVPVRKGITTYFVTGDDHEGWWAQRELFNIGEVMESRARKAGRKDLVYIGHVESDIEFRYGEHSAAGRVMHPGGGSAYAYSYTSQKIVEAFQGGEKPAIVFGGHYHKYDYCYPREVHFIQGGCTSDQTMFMRKNKIAAHVGYVNVELEQDAGDGHLTEVMVGWRAFYDRGYYEARFE